MWLFAGLAMAGGLTHRTTREPLPARWVERPLVLPAGWKQVDVAVGPGAVAASGRLSLGPLAELRASGGSDEALAPPTIGAAMALGRREAPARSASLQFTWQVPALGRERAHRLELASPVRVQWGGSRWTVAPVADVATVGFDARVGLRGETGLQAGPLGVTAAATAWYAGTTRANGQGASWAGALGGFVQLNRAFRVHGSARVGDDEGGLLGVELSL